MFWVIVRYGRVSTIEVWFTDYKSFSFEKSSSCCEFHVSFIERATIYDQVIICKFDIFTCVADFVGA